MPWHAGSKAVVMLREAGPASGPEGPMPATNGVTPQRKGNKISPPEVLDARRRAGCRHSSKRITVGHALADQTLETTCWTDRRETLPATYRAIASHVSDTPPADSSHDRQKTLLARYHAPCEP
ncbi:hypothetical protein ACFYPT_41415 [Streptomyces sp. NPDC005529]|uniref:hypothetical protein n=1 Tax=unclassified Streptomyces TaxID=2593676 RepID=UPI0033B84378